MFVRKSLPMGTVQEADVTLPLPEGAAPAESMARSRSHRVSIVRLSASSTTAAAASSSSNDMPSRRPFLAPSLLEASVAAVGGGGLVFGGRSSVLRSGSTQSDDTPVQQGLVRSSKGCLGSVRLPIVASGPPAVAVAPWDDEARMLALKV